MLICSGMATPHGQLAHALPATDRVRTESTVTGLATASIKSSILHAG